MGGCSKSWDFVANWVGAVYNRRVQFIMGDCSKLLEVAVNYGRVQ